MAKLRVACPHCHKVYRVDESHLGQSARCKQCAATFVLARQEGQDVGALIAALGRELAAEPPRADPRAAGRALDALCRIGEPALVPLIEALRQTTYAHKALARIGGERAFLALCAELDSDDPYRAIAAADALARIGDPRALPALKRHRWNRDHDVRAAVHEAATTIHTAHREMAQGRWFAVDAKQPCEQVRRVRWQLPHIVHDPPLRQRALRWHHDFCAAMPTMAFASDAERADTWHQLGTLIFALLNPDKQLILRDGRPTIECSEAAFCFAQARRLQP